MEIYMEVVILLLAIITAILLRLCLHISCRRYDCNRSSSSQADSISTGVGIGRTFRLRGINGQYYDTGRNEPPPSYIVVIENTPPPPTYEEYLKLQTDSRSVPTIVKTEADNVILNANGFVSLGYI